MKCWIRLMLWWNFGYCFKHGVKRVTSPEYHNYHSCCPACEAEKRVVSMERAAKKREWLESLLRSLDQ